MASLQVFNPSLSLISRSDFDFGSKQSCFCWLSAPEANRKRVLRLTMYQNSKSLIGKGLRVRCGVDDKNQSEEPPESLFMKELRKRGITPTSLLEDRKMNSYEIDEQIYLTEKEREFFRRNAVSTDVEKELLNQRERSMALNSEGLEGLIPRAKLLVTIGGTFFLGFVPLILLTVAFFSALYLIFLNTLLLLEVSYFAYPWRQEWIIMIHRLSRDISPSLQKFDVNYFLHFIGSSLDQHLFMMQANCS